MYDALKTSMRGGRHHLASLRVSSEPKSLATNVDSYIFNLLIIVFVLLLPWHIIHLEPLGFGDSHSSGLLVFILSFPAC